MLALKTILHQTDYSERSESAFQLACSLARDHGARIVLLHVVELPTAVYGAAGGPTTVLQVSMDEEKEGLNRIKVPKDVTVERRLVEGEAAHEILRTAEEVSADLIVLGTHGRTGMSRLLFGSVAEQVLRRAQCPVLTIKEPLQPTQPSGEPQSHRTNR
jgi:nucleotide-binding universal stress UspA family protein